MPPMPGSDFTLSSDAHALLAADRFANLLGVSLVSSADGEVAAQLTVREEHANFLGMTHGGVVISLADIVMGLSANAGQEAAVAVDMQISYVRAARPGDLLTARGRLLSATRSFGWHQVEVENQEGKPVGLFRGTVYRPGPR